MAGRKPVLLLDRFDRAFRHPHPVSLGDERAWRERQRKPQLSRNRGCHPVLWGGARCGLAPTNVMISNTDYHLRNHGFLYAGGAGWRLPPAYDLNLSQRIWARTFYPQQSIRKTPPHRRPRPERCRVLWGSPNLRPACCRRGSQGRFLMAHRGAASWHQKRRSGPGCLCFCRLIQLSAL
jgi:HipA-like C-terminal domain